jgi:hypothetical protein
LRNSFALACRKKNKTIPKRTLAKMGETETLATNEEKLEMTCEWALHGLRVSSFQFLQEITRRM